jgi:hypothetical protein
MRSNYKGKAWDKWINKVTRRYTDIFLDKNWGANALRNPGP